MYHLTQFFTSRDGRLEPDNREYGMQARYLPLIEDVKNHLGGSTHIFVKINGGPSNKAIFFTRDGNHSFEVEEKKETGWAEYSLTGDAGYKPNLGETGWWNAAVAGAPSQIVENIGLPYNWHVSHFLILDWKEGQTQPSPTYPPQKNLRLEFSISAQTYAVTVRLYTDGTYEISEIT